MNILSEILGFFKDKDFSPVSKILGCIFVLALFYFIDNHLGFSFSYRNSRLISELAEIEELKQKSQSNLKLLQYLNEKETNIIERRTLTEKVLLLFSNVDMKVGDNQSINEIRDTRTGSRELIIYNLDSLLTQKSDSFLFTQMAPKNYKPKVKFVKPVTVKRYRSQIWHTISSSYIYLLLIILFVIIPFTQKDDKQNIFLGCLLINSLLLFLVWFNQYLFGLIPVINNRPWINYSVNFILHTIFVSIFVGLIFLLSRKNN